MLKGRIQCLLYKVSHAIDFSFLRIHFELADFLEILNDFTHEEHKSHNLGLEILCLQIPEKGYGDLVRLDVVLLNVSKFWLSFSGRGMGIMVSFFPIPNSNEHFTQLISHELSKS